MKIKDREFRVFIGEAELHGIVDRLADEISRDYAGRDLVVCPVLTGAFMFAADLVRRLTVPAEVRFVRYASYSGMHSTGTVNCSMPPASDLAGRDVLLVEDVVDTGLSMKKVLADTALVRPASLRLCTLLFKPDAFAADYKVDYIGRNIGNEFIVGYGLDYDEQGRTLPEIYVINE